MIENLFRKIQRRTATIAVFGQGYVGLPLAISFARAGFTTIGVDIRPDLVSSLNNRKSRIRDEFIQHNLSGVISRGKYQATLDAKEAVKEADFIIICVPTPLSLDGKIDLTCLENASKMISCGLTPGKVVIVESSTYPGTTEEVIQPLLESSGLKVGVDFWLASCPERVDPRNKDYTLHNTPRVVGAIDKESRKLVISLYKTIMNADLIPVSGIKIAEATKMLENAFRLVNIAFIFEFAMLSEKMGIDVWEVIQAAATKPFGFSAHYPSAGIGGHCIPVDPVYLLEKGKELGYTMQLIEKSLEINQQMLSHVVELIEKGFRERGIKRKDGAILIYGLTYKEDVDDTRNSAGIKILKNLEKRGYTVFGYDPLLSKKELERLDIPYIQKIEKAVIKNISCLCITQYHTGFIGEINSLVLNEKIPLVIDTKNRLPKIDDGENTILCLGLGKDQTR